MSRCVPPCGHGVPKSGNLPAEPVKNALTTQIEARSEETPQILLSTDISAPEVELVGESEPPKAEITTEKETKEVAKPQTAQSAKPYSSSAEPQMGDVRIVDGAKQIYIDGFGWIKDEGSGNVGIPVDGKGDINKQVGIMGGGSVAEDMYENGRKIGIMGGDESAPHETTAPSYEQPELTGDEIYVPIQPPVTKDSTPPAYKPNGEPYNP